MELSESLRYTSNPSEIAWKYLRSLPEHEAQTTEQYADQLLSDGPLAPCTVIIPVAAKQEAHNILRSMSCYARQDTQEPFTVVLGLNADVPATDESVRPTLDAVEAAKTLYPELDLRTTYRIYSGQTTIGDIRRDTWNGVLFAGLVGQTITSDTDILGINHDIDTHSLPRKYMQRVQDYAKDPIRKGSPTYTELRHSLDSRTPNISRFTFWSDFLHHNYGGGIGYEAGALIPMQYYAEQGGIRPNTATHEIGSFIQDDVRRKLWKTGMLQTSPRRYQARLAVAGPEKIWTDDSFTTSDDCRNVDFTPEDISEQELKRRILQLNYLVPGVVMNLRKLSIQLASTEIEQPMTHDEYIEYFERTVKQRKKIASRTLAYCVALPNMVTEVIENQCSDMAIRETAVDRAEELRFIDDILRAKVLQDY